MPNLGGHGLLALGYFDPPRTPRLSASPHLNRSMLSPGGYVRQGSSDRRGGPPARAVNVQVAVRCRPLNQRERGNGDRIILSCDQSRREIQFSPPLGRKAPTGSSNGRKTFTYDHVFGPEATQQEVYKGVVEPIVDEVLQGYNCTVFAYGQTGTGKTHTMEGRRDEYTVDISEKRLPNNAGMIPRAVKHVFEHLRSITDEHSVKVSHLELYNEQLTDLLGPEEESVDLRMYEDSQKGVFVNGLDEVVVKSEEEIFEILDRSAIKRRTAETLMNKFSSRSHSVFSITIHIKESTPDGADLLKVGKLNLVDLAGSENVGRSGAVKGRAREAGNINQSLLTLGRVITALVEHHPHIPYRDSKLTRLLQESLGGRNKTCVIATATPGSSSYEETASTLDYAYRAKSIKNRPTVNQMIAKHVLLKDYTDEIAKLKRELDAARSKHGVYLPKDEHERLLAFSTSQGESISTLEGKLVEKDKAITECKQLLQKSQNTTQDKQRELNKTAEILALTEKNLEEKLQELDDERFVSMKYKQQAVDYRSKGMEMQDTLQKTVKDIDGLQARVAEHKRIEEGNNRRISHLREKMAESDRQYRSLLKSYKSKQDLHLEAVQSRVADFVSQAGSKISQITRNFKAFRQHSEALQKGHNEDASKFEEEVTEGSRKLESTCNASINTQVNRLHAVVEDVSSGCESINGVLSKLAEDVQELSVNFKIFENKQAAVTREFVAAQKSRLDSVSADVSSVLGTNERRLLSIGTELTKSRAMQMKEMDNMFADAIAQMTQVFEACKIKQAEMSKIALDNANLGFQKSVEESRNGTINVTKLVEELFNAEDAFQTSTRNDRSKIASTVSYTAAEATENSSLCKRIVDGQSSRVTELLTEAKQNELKLKANISQHCADTNDIVQTRNIAHLDEISAKSELLKEAEETLTGRLDSVKDMVSEHEGYLADNIEQNKLLANEERTKTSEVITDSVIEPINTFEIERDVSIDSAPRKQAYTYPASLDEIYDRSNLVEENRHVNSGEGPMSSISSSPAEVIAKLEANKEDPEKTVMKPVAPDWSSDGRSEDETLTEDKVTDDLSMYSESAADSSEKASVPDTSSNRGSGSIQMLDTTNVSFTRKRRAVARSKSSGIRRPRTLSKKAGPR